MEPLGNLVQPAELVHPAANAAQVVLNAAEALRHSLRVSPGVVDDLNYEPRFQERVQTGNSSVGSGNSAR